MDVKKSLAYAFEPEKYLFGMCEEFEGSLDKGAVAAKTIDLVAAVGAKSMRIWMHHKRLFYLNADTHRLEWRQDVFLRYRGYVERLCRRGIRIVAMNHNYVFPASFSGDKESVSEFPEPGTEAYLAHLNLIAEGYALMAAAFPEIEYWECGNEVNMNFYMAKPGYKAQKIGNAEYVPQFCYNNFEKAAITADLCYYATMGVKKGNSKAFVVFPAPTPYRGYAEMAEFYEAVYGFIESGNFPSGQKPDTDADHYFQVQCYHAYNFGGDATLLEKGAEMIYRIMCAHGDGGKKAFISEFGYHDSDFVKTRGMTKQQADETQAAFFESDFAAFRKAGFIESVFVFRLYDWLVGPGIEIDFGLFTSPSSLNGLEPKAKGLALYRMFGGKNPEELSEVARAPVAKI